jgi:tRNA (Thr-GGU) A37 N-methylase
LETNNANITGLSYFKLLATIAGDDSTISGKNYAVFSSIKLDSVNKTPVVDVEDYATVSVSGNSATISVSKP